MNDIVLDAAPRPTVIPYKRYGYISLGLAIAQVILYPFTYPQVTDVDKYLEMLALPAQNAFLSQPLISLVLGALAALIPFRDLPYSKRYWRASMLTLVVLLAIFLFATMCGIAATKFFPGQ